MKENKVKHSPQNSYQHPIQQVETTVQQQIPQQVQPQQMIPKDKKDPGNLDTLIKKFCETIEPISKLNIVDKIVKQSNSPSLSGILLDNLIKGLVKSL